MNPLCTRSASELARMIREGQVSSREVVDAHIAQSERAAAINAVVVDRYDAARREADLADARLAREGAEGLPRFHGVPCSIKESFALESMPWTAGLVARKGTLAVEDAPTVARYRAAGLIPLGVTNTSELCMWFESDNRVYGRTSSAYDPARTAGGSSGGEGAVVGAGASPVGLGADIGGSIRMPAFFNGVFGHKPSGGLLPNTGQFPAPEGDARRMCAAGPITRRAEDLFPLLELLAGPDGVDDSVVTHPLRRPDEVDVRGLTILDVRDDASLATRPVERCLLDAQERAVRALSRRGAKIVQRSVPGLRQAFDIWGATLHAANSVSFAELLGNGERLRAGRLLREAPGALRELSEFTLPALGLALVERLPELLPARAERLHDAGRRLRAELESLLGDNGVMLYPSHRRAAPRHRHPMLSFPDAGFTGIFNVLHFPVTQVPLGLDERVLPTGVQVVGAWGNDHLTLAVARALEEDLGGWVPPPRWSAS
ncbi:MAG: amidase [Polyangiales bacterium]